MDPTQEDSDDEDEETKNFDVGNYPPDVDFLPRSETAEAITIADSDNLAPANAKDWTTYWSITVPGLQVDRDQALTALQGANNDALAAYQALLKGGNC